MRKYEHILVNIENLQSLSQLNDEELLQLQSSVEGLDCDYLEFLRTIGFGNLGEIQLYSGLISPTTVYSTKQGELDHIVLFGDDQQGYCFGFDRNDGLRVVEIDPKGNVSKSVEPTFFELLSAYFT